MGFGPVGPASANFPPALQEASRPIWGERPDPLALVRVWFSSPLLLARRPASGWCGVRTLRRSWCRLGSRDGEVSCPPVPGGLGLTSLAAGAPSHPSGYAECSPAHPRGRLGGLRRALWFWTGCVAVRADWVPGILLDPGPSAPSRGWPCGRASRRGIADQRFGDTVASSEGRAADGLPRLPSLGLGSRPHSACKGSRSTLPCPGCHRG